MVLLVRLAAIGHEDIVAASLGRDRVDLAGLGIADNFGNALLGRLALRVVEVVEQQRQRGHQDDQIDKAIL